MFLGIVEQPSHQNTAQTNEHPERCRCLTLKTFNTGEKRWARRILFRCVCMHFSS